MIHSTALHLTPEGVEDCTAEILRIQEVTGILRVGPVTLFAKDPETFRVLARHLSAAAAAMVAAQALKDGS